jgi:hypothetical protein
MLKWIVLLTLFQFSVVTHAAGNCANSIAELKTLVGNPGLATRWLENAKKNQLTLNLSNNGGNLKLLLTTAKGMWATVSGTICKVAPEQYVATVANMSWGPAAPGLVKIFSLKTIKMDMPYQTQLKVTAKGMNFTFEAQ